MTTVSTAPAPAVAPTVPPMSPLAQAVTLTGVGVVSGCLGLVLVWHEVWTLGAPLTLAASALFLSAAVCGVPAGQDGS